MFARKKGIWKGVPDASAENFHMGGIKCAMMAHKGNSNWLTIDPPSSFGSLNLAALCFNLSLAIVLWDSFHTAKKPTQQHQIVCAPYFDYYIITVILLLLFECKRPYSLEYVQDLLRTWHAYHWLVVLALRAVKLWTFVSQPVQQGQQIKARNFPKFLTCLVGRYCWWKTSG